MKKGTDAFSRSEGVETRGKSERARVFSSLSRYPRPADRSTGILSDHAFILTAIDSAKAYPGQVLSVTLFEKAPILWALQAAHSQDDLPCPDNQLILLDS